MYKKLLLLLPCFLSVLSVYSQHNVRVYGYVIDEDKRGIEDASVGFENSNVSTLTNPNGFYELNFNIKDSATIVFSQMGYQTLKYTIRPKQRVVQISVELKSFSKQIKEVNVIGHRKQISTVQTLDPNKYRLLPNTSGGIESLFITFSGVSSSNELSSQYNVRGGNFDENSVYVNGIEVYRPLLVRAGQQEGLSFINSDMVENVSFSSGGFNAEYGDKMSSVLDIQYKKPTHFEATGMASLLGASAYLGTGNGKFTQMHGIRYKTSRYLLGTLDTKGEYKPSFIDYQTYLTYKIHPKWEMTFTGNFSQNSYNFVPQTRETTFGTYNMGRKLTIYFDGQEKDLFRTYFGAYTLNFNPNKNLKLSMLYSAFHTNERETYDISGEYILSEVKMDTDPGEETTGESLGIGRYMQHARNRLNADVSNIAHLGEYKLDKHLLKWGVYLQNEHISDKISEWEWRDSVGYSLPYTGDQVNLYYNLKAKTSMNSWRGIGFLQDTYKIDASNGVYYITGGLRANYWNFNREFLLSPRLSVAFLPQWKHDFSFRLATGIYYQSPFYKELRDTVTDASGNVNVLLNKTIKAQRSFHLVLGGDYFFRAWGRPFKFTAEAYLKLADRVISYTVDNVMIRYSGLNDARAYTAGVDFKLYGEVVPGVDTWINLSLMDSKENINGDTYVKKTYDEDGNVVSSETLSRGWMSRPTDQRYTFSMLFQDYWPNNPKYKLHLKLIWSDGLPFGPPRNVQYRDALRTSPYRRVDIGISRLIAGGKGTFLDKPGLKYIRNIWLNAEVLNLLDFKNINSYYWVSDVYGQQYAVPNYLTGRQFNLKLIVDMK